MSELHLNRSVLKQIEKKFDTEIFFLFFTENFNYSFAKGGGGERFQVLQHLQYLVIVLRIKVLDPRENVITFE